MTEQFKDADSFDRRIRMLETQVERLLDWADRVAVALVNAENKIATLEHLNEQEI